MKERILAVLEAHRYNGPIWSKEEGQRVRCLCQWEGSVEYSDLKLLGVAANQVHRSHVADMLVAELRQTGEL